MKRLIAFNWRLVTSYAASVYVSSLHKDFFESQHSGSWMKVIWVQQVQHGNTSVEIFLCNNLSQSHQSTQHVDQSHQSGCHVF